MVEKKPMKTSDLVLRCYAEREQDGTWFAICLDLNLAVQADSAKAAKAKLHAQIVQYVKDALTVDREYFSDLLPRRAPIGFFVRYYFIKTLCALRGFDRGRKSAKRVFKENLPVVPA